MKKTATVKSEKITLNLGERISISTMLPLEGDYNFFIIKKDILKKIAVTQDELKKYEIETKISDDKKSSWLHYNDEGVKAKFHYEFTELEKNEIRLSLIKISEEKKLIDALVNIYEIFVGKK